MNELLQTALTAAGGGLNKIGDVLFNPEATSHQYTLPVINAGRYAITVKFSLDFV